MAKKLPMTPKIRELILSATDGAVDPDAVSVYEAISINNLPVSKTNIFEGAVHSSGTLREMAAVVNARPLKTHVPVHTVHNQSYGELPVGKTFHAGVFDQNGVEELRSYFWLPNTEKELIDKLEGGAIEEVSVGVRYKHLNCSECGWDYLGADATMDNIWERVCANDHHIGTNGVHLKLNGLDRWMEQSLVSIGAAQGAKIVARTRALLGQETYNQLAASGLDPSATTLYATATPPKEKDPMDLTQLVKELTDAKVLIAQKDTEILNLKKDSEQLPELKAKVTSLEAEVSTLKSTDVVKVTAERTAALSFIQSEEKRLAGALGITPKAATATVQELTASIEDNRKKLADAFPVGGRSEPQGTTQKEGQSVAHSASFKTAR